MIPKNKGSAQVLLALTLDLGTCESALTISGFHKVYSKTPITITPKRQICIETQNEAIFIDYQFSYLHTPSSSSLLQNRLASLLLLRHSSAKQTLNKMANIFLLGIYAISAIGFLVQMYYVSEELMTPSFSDIEMKREKLGLKEFHRKYQVQILSPFTQSQIQNGKIRIWTMKVGRRTLD